MKTSRDMSRPPLHPAFYKSTFGQKGESEWAISEDFKEAPKRGEWFSFPSKGENEPYQKTGRSLTEYKVPPTKTLTTLYEIEVGGIVIGELPVQLYEIKKAIDAARYMLELEEDWDDEGGMPVEQNTFIRAIRFLINYSVWLIRNQSFLLAPPQINPGPDDSIDILWRTRSYRLLINIPQDPAKQAGYYGEDKKGGNSIEGKIPTETIKEFLATWMKNLKN